MKALHTYIYHIADQLEREKLTTKWNVHVINVQNLERIVATMLRVEDNLIAVRGGVLLV